MERAEINQILGANIRARRKARGLSLNGLAKRLGVSYQQLQKYENGGNRLSCDKLVPIAEALRCTVCDLLDPVSGHPASMIVLPKNPHGVGYLVSLFEKIESNHARDTVCGIVEVLTKSLEATSQTS